MANKFKIKMVTPDGKSLQDEVDILNVVTSSGALGIMANHLPLVATLVISHINYKKSGKSFDFATSGGIISVGKDETILLLDSFESKEEIDLERANNSKIRAENRLNSKDENIDIKRAEVALKRAINRITLAK
ncbi:MAG: ATP synthase F1 subunit epsilon [Bacilli bacterium]|nr:ATP synthase F1 subunit epsilon [Bacilli bacterium]